MAEVFRGRVSGAAGFEKIVAIKRILPQLSDDEDFISLFIDEAKISANLNHSNIGQVFEFGRIESRYFIAMEFISGKDLRTIQTHFAKAKEVMDIPMAVRVILEVCNALEYAHSKKDHNGTPLNIIHRDVSPQNVLISFEGAVKLIDFGIAKALSSSSATATGNLKGKFDYMSPEQVEGKPVDHRSDLFALGTLLWELLTGERLFRGNSELATLEKVRKAVIPPPSTHNPSVKSALEEIVLKALAKDRDARYQRAEELHEDLERFAQTHRMTFSSKQLSRWMKNTFIADNLNQTKPNPLMRKIRARPDGSVPSPEIALPRRRKPANTLQGFEAPELQGLAPPQPEFQPTVQQRPERVSELRSQLLGGKKPPGPPGPPPRAPGLPSRAPGPPGPPPRAPGPPSRAPGPPPRAPGPPGMARPPAPAVPAPRSKPLMPAQKPVVPAPASLPAFDGDEPETRVSDEVARLAAEEAEANPQTLISSDTADLAATFAQQGGPPPAAPKGAAPRVPPPPASMDALLTPEPIGGSSLPGVDELDDNAETLIHMKGQTPEPQPLPGPPAAAPPPASAEVVVMPGGRSLHGAGPDPALSALPTAAPGGPGQDALPGRPSPLVQPELPGAPSAPPAQPSPPGGVPDVLRPTLPGPPAAPDSDAFPELEAGELDGYEFDGPTVVDPDALETVKQMEADRRVSAITEMVLEETGSSADKALPGPPPDDGEEGEAALEFAPHDMSDDELLAPAMTDPDAIFTSQAEDMEPVPARRRGWLLPVILIGGFVLLAGIASAVYLLVFAGQTDGVPGETPKVEPKAKTAVKPKPKPKTKPKPKKVAQATPLKSDKPEPKVEPKPEPKVEPKVVVKPQPKPKPKPRPKVVVKPRPRPRPKVVVKPKSKPKPKPKPRIVRPRPRPRPGKKGTLIIASKPWAHIYIDGKDTYRNTPVPPSNPLKLSPGSHKVILEVGSKRFTFSVMIRAGEMSKLIKKLPASR